MSLANALVVSLIMAAKGPMPPTIDKIVAVTLYRELQTDDFQWDHRLMLAVIRNRSASKRANHGVVCLERWQFSYWNRFWLDGRPTLTLAALDYEYSKVPQAFLDSMRQSLNDSPFDDAGSGINHFYSPPAMRPKHSEPTWAKGKTPKHITRKFRYYAL